ncbi:LURP-one-related/scramblase family protein [Salinigranum halophilum]|jgi:uncharacterized protein YxjI|uniref:hypothetical protein n=1 Tax=Salinigranum halophilum TaxID=2565931 RepID=UPI0010A8563A|nr:hypothetical protein [Salinigranum halophilum]
MFDATHYEVRQKLGIRTRYNVYEGDSDAPILTAKKKKLKLKEDFRFTTPDGEEAFRVRADSVLDIAAAYDIVDSRTGERVGSLQREVASFFKHEYTLVDANGTRVAVLREDNHLMAALRRLVTTLIPFSYDIVAPDGTSLGSVDEQFSFRDRYTIDLTGDLDPRLAVVGTVVVDAIEGN